MKRVIALAALVILLVMTFSLFSCGKQEEEAETFYASDSPRRALTSKLEVSLKGYDFSSFLNRGMIKVSSREEESTRFGVLDKDGEEVLPVSFSALSMHGDFFLTEGSLGTELYSVYNLKGERLLESDKTLELFDVGEGCFSVVVDEKATRLYDAAGEEILGGTSLDGGYEYSVFDSYVEAYSSNSASVVIFNRLTGDTLLSFFGTETLSYNGFYLGNNVFLILKEETVSSLSDATYAVKRSSGTEYLRQTLLLYTIGNKTPRVLTSDKAVYTLTDRNSIGFTSEDRENFSLKQGYFALRYYQTVDKVTDGTLLYCVTDASLREVASLPEGVNPLIRPIDGVGAVLGDSGTLYLVDDRLQLLFSKDDGTYRFLSFSGEYLTVSDTSKKNLRGVFDKSGKVLVPFEYAYISDFYGDKAIGVKNNLTYIICADGSARLLSDVLPYEWQGWQGFYLTRSGDKVGLTSFDGLTLLPPVYDAQISAAYRDGSEIFVAMQKDQTQVVYRLF